MEITKIEGLYHTCWCGREVDDPWGFCSEKCRLEFEEFTRMMEEADPEGREP